MVSVCPMFNVLVPQNLIQDFPFSISCVDQFQKKIFVGLKDGSILDYEIEEEPFTITLRQVHKKAKSPGSIRPGLISSGLHQVKSGLKQLLILPISRALALLSSGIGYNRTHKSIYL